MIRPVVLAALLLPLAAATQAADPARTVAARAPAEAGAAIYLRGELGSGAPLTATRAGGGPGATGRDAACVNCHQRSGLGSMRQRSGLSKIAGSTSVPPIAARYLLEPLRAGGDHHGKLDLPFVEGMRTNRRPYTEETLARAIREGLDSEGRPLGVLMPRFALGEADMAALIGYLKTLAPARVPGVSDSTLHFATVFTPEADPARRAGVLEVIQKYFVERNTRQMKPSAQLQASGRTQYSRSMFMVHRQWQLHVWDLTGPEATWKEQLARDLAREPVMAVISGLGGAHWAPVHEFCERSAVPCLFPNAEVPVDARDDFFNLYLSKGVLLEAELIASRILGPDRRPPAGIVHQVFRAADSGEAAARRLAERLERQGVTVRNHVLTAGGDSVAEAVRAVGDGDVLVLWLRPPDLETLAGVPAGAAPVFVSGLMGNLEHAPLPAGWRARARMAYVFDLPQKRIVRVDYPLGWFRISKIAVVDERLQADTYLACGLLSEALNNLAGTFDQAYLVEQMQGMVEHRIVTGYYPRLTLAENQHFASKGGYIVRFADESGPKLAADGDWFVP